MVRIIICLSFFFLILCSNNAAAQYLSPEQNYNGNDAINEYFSASPENKNKSIIYIFYNNEPCDSCPQTIDLIEKIYKSYYADNYSLFIINYQAENEYNFIETYQLRQPLEIVLVRINDGAVFGYQKIRKLQEEIYDPISFTQNFKFRVNEFLGNGGSNI